MKVLNLGCRLDHRFEGWFGSDDDATSQLDGGQVECPICGDRTVHRLPSAPRLNLRTSSRTSPVDAEARLPVDAAGSAAPSKPAGDAAPAMTAPEQLQAAYVSAVNYVLKNTEDVGNRFAEEARRMHYNEVPHRGIRGQATSSEREALLDEGIEVVPLPLPKAIKGPVQ